MQNDNLKILHWGKLRKNLNGFQKVEVQLNDYTKKDYRNDYQHPE